MSLLTLTLLSTVTALATGLGALPLAWRSAASPRGIGLASALAAALMLAASAGLVREGLAYGAGLTAGGAVLGALFVYAAHAWAARQPDAHVWGLSGAGARRALLIFGVMFAHSFTEGVGLGVSFAGDAALGAFVTVTMALHNIPEGLAIALVLVPQGMSMRRASGWAVLSSLPQPLMAVPAYLFVERFAVLLPLGLGFAAGAMTWLALTDLLPDAVRQASSRSVAAVVAVVGFAAALAGWLAS